MRLSKEEIVKEATDHEDGELLKEFKCSYCNRIKRKTVIPDGAVIPDYSTVPPLP